MLEAPGPSKNGYRSVVAIYADGRALVPFSSYDGMNSGIPIKVLTEDPFRGDANALFGFRGTERQARTASGWLTEETAGVLLDFCRRVAREYEVAATEEPVGV